jgi:hypothetical protein
VKLLPDHAMHRWRMHCKAGDPPIGAPAFGDNGRPMVRPMPVLIPATTITAAGAPNPVEIGW